MQGPLLVTMNDRFILPYLPCLKHDLTSGKEWQSLAAFQTVGALGDKYIKQHLAVELMKSMAPVPKWLYGGKFPLQQIQTILICSKDATV